MKSLQEQVRKLPRQPGVYIMYNSQGEVIYVGKAKSLHDRVSSYFGKEAGLTAKTILLVSHIDRFEYIVTETETEALILESTLIKKHQPHYNVLLKDDKHYPYIKVTVNEKFPSIQVVRDKKDDGARYFGPFPRSGIIKPTVKFLSQFFPVRTCQGAVSSRKPCLNYHIQRCLGPCVEKVSEEVYRQLCSEVVLFLEGKYEKLKRHIEARMKESASREEYEAAAIFRDRLSSLQRVTEKQNAILESGGNVDVAAVYEEERILHLCIMVYTEGFLINQYNYSLDKNPDDDFEELLAQGFIQHYVDRQNRPDALLLPPELEQYSLFRSAIQATLGSRTDIKYPRIGRNYELINLAARNVKKFIGSEELLTPRVRDELDKLRDILQLQELPRTIVGFDISNLAGTNIVASAVFFENGHPNKKRYKRFRVRSVSRTQDDYQAMREVVHRYFSKVTQVDIILIDGGKGQLTAALEGLAGLPVRYQKIVALAKREEVIFTPDRQDGIRLPRSSNALHLLQRVRDEAHRFALKYQKQRRHADSFASALDGIPGLGKDRIRKLLLHFGSVEAVKKATPGDIINVPGLGSKIAKKIYDIFH